MVDYKSELKINEAKQLYLSEAFDSITKKWLDEESLIKMYNNELMTYKSNCVIVKEEKITKALEITFMALFGTALIAGASILSAPFIIIGAIGSASSFIALNDTKKKVKKAKREKMISEVSHLTVEEKILELKKEHVETTLQKDNCFEERKKLKKEHTYLSSELFKKENGYRLKDTSFKKFDPEVDEIPSLSLQENEKVNDYKQKVKIK